MKSLLILSVLLVMTAGCSAPIREPELRPIDQSRMPPPDLSVTIPGLGPCTDSPDHALHLNSQQPVMVLVHGCLGSAGRFRALAEVFAFSGQQAVCFSYNDRDSLMVSSAQLATALEELAGHLQRKDLTVIGHSQGGLIARKALVAERPQPFQALGAELELVTISAPFAGIEAASHCGSTLATIFSLGLTVPICKLAAGDKWYEITGASDFIRQPGDLLGQVKEHLKINTEESGSCRRVNADGNCAQSDYVFSLEEQHLPLVNAGTVATNVVVKAGHVEIVGDNRVAPFKLIATLQERGILKTPAPERTAAFGQMLTLLYQRLPPTEAQ